MDDLVGCLKQGRKRNQTKTSYLIHLFLLPFTNMIVIYLFDPLARLILSLCINILSFLPTPGDASKFRVAWNKTQDVPGHCDPNLYSQDWES